MGHTWPFQFGFSPTWEQRHLMEMAGTVLLYLCMFPSGYTWRFESSEIVFIFRTWDTHGRFNCGHANNGISWRWRVRFFCTYARFEGKCILTSIIFGSNLCFLSGYQLDIFTVILSQLSSNPKLKFWKCLKIIH